MQYRPTVILMIVLTAIAVPLSLLAAGDSTLPWDVAVTNRLQQVNSSGVEKAVNALNWYGRFAPVAVTSLIISIVLMAKRRYREAGFVLTVFLLSRAANGILKLGIGSPRPDGDLVRGSGQASGYGFPSGHAMSTLIFIGALIYLLYLNDTRNSLRVVALIAGFIFALGMGFSRIYVGAHWPSDVVGAYLWGGIFLVAIIAVYRWLRARNLGWR